ncbi:hypothetical protein CCH79_00012440, partial [Gambusia affinis]
MGRRKSKRKPPPKKKMTGDLETQFTCPFCNHEKSCDVKMERSRNTGVISCSVCLEEFQTPITCILFTKWIIAREVKCHSVSLLSRLPINPHSESGATVARETAILAYGPSEPSRSIACVLKWTGSIHVPVVMSSIKPRCFPAGMFELERGKKIRAQGVVWMSSWLNKILRHQDLNISLITYNPLGLPLLISLPSFLPLPPPQLSKSGLPVMATRVDVSSVLTTSCEEIISRSSLHLPNYPKAQGLIQEKDSAWDT